MKLPSLLPPADLLEKIEGVEQGLRKRRQLSAIGWVGLLVGAGSQVLAALADSEWLTQLRELDWSEIAGQWPLLLLLAVGVFSFLLLAWSRFWLRESREPFRYTFSIGDFIPEPASPAAERLSWLRHDLEERLSTRIGRLSLLEEGAGSLDDSTETGAERPPLESHIHVRGHYVIRERAALDLAEPGGDGQPKQLVEIRTWVRIGPPGRPQTFAYPVKYNLKYRGDALGPPSSEQRPPENPADAPADGEPPAPLFPLDQRQYERIVERAYFSVATQIYRQLREDVQTKIDLLPTKRFRATAYVHEAEDYARSNTLDAYEEARKLYEEARRIYGDPSLRSLAGSRVLRALQYAFRWAHGVYERARGSASRVWPRLGRLHVKIARAEIGHANMLVYRRELASLSGRVVNTVFEARPVAEKAVARLERLADRVPGRRDSLFDAYVTLALAWVYLGSARKGQALLETARRLDPHRAQQDSRYFFVRGEAEPGPRSAVPFFRRAVELDPVFEVAQFRLADSMEMAWRARPTFERTEAAMVFEEYEHVLALNPGNVAAWANLGYMAWLLEDQQRAEYAFESGREYKEIKRETFVAELDYGLGRLAAERGDFATAYRHYSQAVSAYLAQGLSHAPYGYTSYFFGLIDERMMNRFYRYRRRVERRRRRASRDPTPGARVLDAVYAFVLNEYGEASFNYYRRASDVGCLRKAREAFEEASALDPSDVISQYNLSSLWEEEVGAGLKTEDDRPVHTASLQTITKRLEPQWPVGILAMAREEAELAAEEQSQSRGKRSEADEKMEEASATRERAARARSRLIQLSFAPEADGTGIRGSVERLPFDGGSATLPHRRELDILAKQSEELEGEAGSLEEEAAALRKQADALMHQAKANLEQATKRLRSLLPHDWLWRTDGRFDWKALDKRSVREELRWEKECDDFHVDVLFAIADLPEGGLEDESAKERLLDHIRRRFWPEGFGVIRAVRDITSDPRAKEECDQVLQATVEHWVAGDPTAFWVLSWCAPPLMGEARAVEVLTDATRDIRLPKSLYRWIGDQLGSLLRPDEALEAFRLAMEGDNAALLREIAQGLEQLDALRRSASGALEACRTAVGQADLSILEPFAWVLHRLEGYKRAMEEEDPALLQPIVPLLERLQQWTPPLWDEILDTYRHAQRVDLRESRRTGSLRFEASNYRDVGRALWALGRPSEALAELDRIAGTAPDLELDWRSAFVRFVVGNDLVTSPADYRLLRTWLERNQTSPANSEDDRRDAGWAVLELVRSVAEDGAGVGGISYVTRADGDENALVPIVTPIAVEADDGLFQEGENTPGLRQILDEHIPRVRDEVAARTDVTMPGVRIRANEILADGQYVVLLHEIPVASAQPPSGTDPYAHMIFEGVREQVLRQLDTFLGVQEVDQLRLAWAAAPGADDRNALWERAAPDLGSRRCLVAALQRLARERVPVGDLSTILPSFAAESGGCTDVEEVVERLRKGLGNRLPGNDGSRAQVRLAPAAEDLIAGWVQEAEGKRWLAVPRGSEADLDALRGALGASLTAFDPDQAVLVVERPEIRRFVRRVAMSVFPSLPVLAADELLRAAPSVAEIDVALHDGFRGAP